MYVGRKPPDSCASTPASPIASTVGRRRSSGSSVPDLGTVNVTESGILNTIGANRRARTGDDGATKTPRSPDSVAVRPATTRPYVTHRRTHTLRTASPAARNRDAFLAPPRSPLCLRYTTRRPLRCPHPA